VAESLLTETRTSAVPCALGVSPFVQLHVSPLSSVSLLLKCLGTEICAFPCQKSLKGNTASWLPSLQMENLVGIKVAVSGLSG